MKKRKVKDPKEKETVKMTPAEKREKEAIEKWTIARKMGKTKYVLLKGTVGWSLLTTSIFILLTLVTNGFKMNNDLLFYLAQMFFAFICMGTLFGLVSWKISEKKYFKYLETHSNHKK